MSPESPTPIFQQFLNWPSYDDPILAFVGALVAVGWFFGDETLTNDHEHAIRLLRSGRSVHLYRREPDLSPGPVISLAFKNDLLVVQFTGLLVKTKQTRLQFWNGRLVAETKPRLSSRFYLCMEKLIAAQQANACLLVIPFSSPTGTVPQ